jgi:5-methylcytosine-specific restriction endonuclease McrBC GTP-binding regulatory subunit McrB
MNLIEDHFLKRGSCPILVLPFEFIGIDHFGRTVDPFGLEPRDRIGPLLISIQEIEIPSSRFKTFHKGSKIPVLLWLQ